MSKKITLPSLVAFGILFMTLTTQSRADDSYMGKFYQCNQPSSADCEVWNKNPNASKKAYDTCKSNANDTKDCATIRKACTLACETAVEENSAKGAKCPTLPERSTEVLESK